MPKKAMFDPSRLPFQQTVTAMCQRWLACDSRVGEQTLMWPAKGG